MPMPPIEPFWGTTIQWIDEHMTEEEIALTQQLEAAVCDVPRPPSYEGNWTAFKRVFLAKFLIARKWDVAAAAEMYRNATKFRFDKALDTTPLFPSPAFVRGFDQEELRAFLGQPPREPGKLDVILKNIQGSFSACWHKVDKFNHPVYIERTGLIKVRRFMDRVHRLTPPGGDLADCTKIAHLHSNEIGGAIVRYVNSKLPDHLRTDRVTCILDCQGLGMGHIYPPILDILKQNSLMDQMNYPEGMYRMYIVNAPSAVYIAWKICCSWIDERIQRKIIFLKPDELTRLQDEIPAENLPEFLGGTCCCEGGCLPPMAEDDEVHEDDELSLGMTQAVQVPRGVIVTRQVEVLAGETLNWDFVVAANSDIVFSAEFQNTVVRDDGSEPELQTTTIIPLTWERLKRHQGSFTATASGELRFSFDNKHAWVHAKTVELRLTKNT